MTWIPLWVQQAWRVTWGRIRGEKCLLSLLFAGTAGMFIGHSSLENKWDHCSTDIPAAMEGTSCYKPDSKSLGIFLDFFMSCYALGNQYGKNVD